MNVMNKSIKINIAKPCSENWSTMTPTEKGKFCSKCSKQVFDLTMLKDIEIFELLKESPNSICGRAEKSQLNRKLSTSDNRNHSSDRFKWIASIFILGSLSNALASPKIGLNTKTYESKILHKNNNVKNKITNDTVHNNLKGYVFSDYGDPVPYATITAVEWNQIFETDENVFFSIPIRSDFSIEYLTLKIESLPFESTEIKFFVKEFHSILRIQLKNSEDEHDVVITGYISKPNIFKRFWWSILKKTK